MIKHRTYTNLQALNPIKTYENSQLEKGLIFEDNRYKAGVYRWINKMNGKTYIGSSYNLTNRFYKYYSNRHLKSTNTPISNALLKYGHKSFSLEILEYSEIKLLTTREQFYLDRLNPSYNLLKFARSSLGYKHTPETLVSLSKRDITDETKARLSIAALGRKLNKQTMIKISNAKLGRVVSSSTRDKISKSVTSIIGIPINVVNINTNELTKFNSLTDAAKSLAVTRAAISKALKNKKLIKGLYRVTKTT